MTSQSYEGNFKAWLLTTQPAGYDPVNGSTVTEVELNAGTRLLRLPSDGGLSYTYTMNTASQALVDEGKVSHNTGTREVTGGQITHEFDFPISADAMYSLYSYGDKRYIVVSPDGVPSADGEVLDILEVEMGEPHKIAPSRDTKQNFMVEFAVQNWDFQATFDAT